MLRMSKQELELDASFEDLVANDNLALLELAKMQMIDDLKKDIEFVDVSDSSMLSLAKMEYEAAKATTAKKQEGLMTLKTENEIYT